MTLQEDLKEYPKRDALAMRRIPTGSRQCAMCPMEEDLPIPGTQLVALVALVAREPFQTAWSQTVRQIREAQALLRPSERRQEHLLEAPEAPEALRVQETKCELVRPPAPPVRLHKAQLLLSQVIHLPLDEFEAPLLTEQ